jgi:hypothetical protein
LTGVETGNVTVGTGEVIVSMLTVVAVEDEEKGRGRHAARNA